MAIQNQRPGVRPPYDPRQAAQPDPYAPADPAPTAPRQDAVSQPVDPRAGGAYGNPAQPWQGENIAPMPTKYAPTGRGVFPPAWTNDAVREPVKPYAPTPWDGPQAVTNGAIGARIDPRLMQRQALLSLISKG